MLWLTRTHFGVLFLLVATSVFGQQPGSDASSLLGVAEGGGATAANTFAGFNQNNALPEGKSWIDPACASQVGPSVVATFEAIGWRLENNQGTLVLLNTTYPPLTAPVRYSNDMDLGFQIGPRIITTFITEEGNYFQVNYTGIYGWSATETVEVPGQLLRVPDAMGTPKTATSGTSDYSAAQKIYLEYDSKYNSVEFNAAFADQDDNFIPLIGFRYIRLDEYYLLQGYTTHAAVPGPPPPYHSDYEIGAKDEMYGLQGGLAYRACVRPRLEIGAWAKFGAFTNNVQQWQTVTDLNRSLVLRNTSGNRWTGSFAADFNLTAMYILNNNVYLRGGYNFMYMTGVARATDQIDFSLNTLAGTGVYTNHNWFAHGFNMGVEVRW